MTLQLLVKNLNNYLMSKNKKYNVFFVLKGKFLTIDNTLPLLLELQSMNLARSLNLVFFDRIDKTDPDRIYNLKSIVEKQQFIKFTLKNKNINLIFLPKIPISADPDLRSANTNISNIKNILLTIFVNFRVLWILREILYTKSLVIGKRFPLMLRIIMKISKKLNKSLYADCHFPNTNSKTFYNVSKIAEVQYGRDPGPLSTINIPKCDIYLSSWPRNKYKEKYLKGDINVPFLNIGYVRGLKAWQNHIEKNINAGIEKTIKDNFFFWPLTVDYRKEPNGITLDLFEPSIHVLKTLKEIDYPLQVVFRNHTSTAPDFVDKITKASEFTNFVLSTAHPQQLIRKSKFLFSQVNTTLFCDAYFLCKPIVQYVSDENKIHHIYGTERSKPTSIYPLYTDFFIYLDKEKFIEVLQNLERKENSQIIRSKEDLEKRFHIYDTITLKNRIERILS